MLMMRIGVAIASRLSIRQHTSAYVRRRMWVGVAVAHRTRMTSLVTSSACHPQREAPAAAAAA